MRQKKTEKKTERRKVSTKEPLSEGIQKKKPRPRYFFTRMSNDELINYAKTIIDEKQINFRKALYNADSSLYQVLRTKNLLEAVIPDKMFRNWSSMTDEEIISFVKTFVKENGIKNRLSLKMAHQTLYKHLRKRKLLDMIIPKKLQRRNWKLMSDEEIISYAKIYLEKNGIKNISSFKKADSGLHEALRKRTLLDAIFPKKRKQRNWLSVTDEEIISYAKTFIREKGINSRKALRKADYGLSVALRRRNLLDAVIPVKQKRRNWSSMTFEEFITYSKSYIRENEISSRKALEKADSGLYQSLNRRKLLDVVFSDIEQTKKVTQVKAVVKAMEDFDGGSE